QDQSGAVPYPGREDGGQRGRRRCLEQCLQGELDTERLADAGGELGSDQRVAAKLKEVIVHSGPVAPQDPGKEPGTRSSNGVRGVPEASAGAVWEGASRIRAWRSTLPLAVRGNASKKVSWLGTM